MKKIPRSRNRETVRAGRTPSERAIALAKLRRLKRTFAEYIGRNFGHLAVDCAKCPTPCCADVQFVNVNITRLEAVAMLEALRRSPSHGPQKVAQTLARARRGCAVRAFGNGRHFREDVRLSALRTGQRLRGPLEGQTGAVHSTWVLRAVGGSA
jgi:hypothetical protein